MTVGEMLREALGGDARDGARPLVLPPAFQGLPGMAHGGTVLALFDAIAGDAKARRVTGHYIKRVPLGAPLVLRVERETTGIACTVHDAANTLLVDGRVMLLADHDAAGSSDATGVGHHAAAESSHATDIGDRAAAARQIDAIDTGAPGAGGMHPLPVSASCFVCGRDNARGLGATLAFDETVVRAAWRPRASFAAPDGTLAPAALTALCDEAAFWLGALATGESGMTTELDVTLHGAVAFGTGLTVIGDRARVRGKPHDARYLVTETAVVDPDGRALATARITFVAVRGAARRLAAAMMPVNAAEDVRRVFPAYVTPP